MARVISTSLCCTVALAIGAADAWAQPTGSVEPVQVFILMGQSNMVGFGRVEPETTKGTLAYLAEHEGKYAHLQDDAGNWTVRDDVWCVKTTVGQKQGWLQPGFGARANFIGPEFQFGHVMGEVHEAPVLIIKASQGNRSLGWDILPPGSEQFTHGGRVHAGYGETPSSWVEGEPREPVNWYAGKQYDDFVRDIHEVLDDLPRFFPGYANQGYEVAGFAWWQGHKDQNAAHASRYERNMVNLIKCLRREFEAPDAPFVLATIAFDGHDLAGHGLAVANAQLAVSGDAGRYPEFAGNVRTVDARGFWRDKAVSPNAQGYHYNHNAETYLEVGNALGRAMADLLAPGDERPLKVFILAGQSNMQGHAHVRTFDAMRLDPTTAPILEEMCDADGTPRVCENVWISSIGSAADEQVGRLTAGFGAQARGPKIGPEFTFGLTMQKRLDGPILIIKTAWGGKSLHTDFRPPGAGAYEFNEAQLKAFEKQGKDVDAIKADRAKASGHHYRLMIDHVKKVLADIERVYPDYDAAQGHELAGFVWFQGWNDMVDRGTYPDRARPGGYDAYSELLAQFIRDVRTDLSAPTMPFVIGVLGVGGPVDEYAPEQQRYTDIHRNFRMAMAAPAARPEFRGNVVAVLTEQYWDREVAALRAREATIKQRKDEINEAVKAGTPGREEAKAAVDRLYADTFTERELVLLRESTSNADFHYMGSARITARIGKAFAEALLERKGPS